MSQTDRFLGLLPVLMALHHLEENLGMEGYARPQAASALEPPPSPTIPAANTNLSTIMVAEHGAAW